MLAFQLMFTITLWYVWKNWYHTQIDGIFNKTGAEGID